MKMCWSLVVGGILSVQGTMCVLTGMERQEVLKDLKGTSAFAKRKALAKLTPEDKITFLWYGISGNDLQLMEEMLKAGAPANAADRSGPLIGQAAEKGKLDALRMLKKYAQLQGVSLANINTRDGNGYTALMNIVLVPDPNISNETKLAVVKELLTIPGIDINAKYDVGTVLMRAVQNNMVDIAKVLIAAGADVNIQDDYQRTAINYAILNNNAEMQAILRAAGATGGQ